MQTPANQESVLEFVDKGTIKGGILIMPTLYSINKYQTYLLWTIHIGILIPSDDDSTEDEVIPITKTHINRGDIPEEAVGAYWMISGQEDGKMRQSAITYIYEGKNAEKRNFTTPFTQAVLDARSLFNKRVRHGNALRKHHLKQPGQEVTFDSLILDRTRGNYPWRVFAMALHNYDKFHDKISFPALVQPKLDGTLFIVVYHPKLNTEDHIDGYSRGRKSYSTQEHILQEMLPIATQYPGLHFVGELWREGYTLQDISGSSRRTLASKLKTETVKLNFNIFDCFYVDKPRMEFVSRRKLLEGIFAAPGTDMPDPTTAIALVPTEPAQDEEEFDQLYEKYLAAGLEGAVIRNTDAPYEFGLNKELRSYQTLKRKERHDAEWPVLDFTDGAGKEAGQVTWVCAENDTGVKKRTGELLDIRERLTFNVTPNQEVEKRKAIYRKLSHDKVFFDNKVFNQLLVVSYSELSRDFLPQQPKALRFRDEKVDLLLSDTSA